VVEDQVQMKNKIDEEKTKQKEEIENSTYMHPSETTCSNYLGRKHKTSKCPSKRVIILRGKDLCENKASLTSSSKEEKQDKKKRYVEQGNIFKLYGFNIRKIRN